MKNSTLYLATIAIWGSTWFAIEFQLGSVPPILSVVYRYALASALLFVWCRARSIRLRYPLSSHRWFVLLGAALFGLNYVLAYSAQVHISSALTAITFATILWMNVINARLFFRTPIAPATIAGAVLGMAGVALLFAPQVDSVSLDDGVFLGTVLSVSGAFVASLGNMASQGAQRSGLAVVPANAWGMFYGALLTAALALVQGQRPAFEWSVAYVGSLLYLAVFGSILAFGAYLTLLGRIGAERAGYAVVAAPVVALLLSSLFEGLELTPAILLGTALVLAGNLFVLRTQGERSRRRSAQSSRPASTMKSLFAPDPEPLGPSCTLEAHGMRARSSLQDPRLLGASAAPTPSLTTAEEAPQICHESCPTH